MPVVASSSSAKYSPGCRVKSVSTGEHAVKHRQQQQGDLDRGAQRYPTPTCPCMKSVERAEGETQATAARHPAQLMRGTNEPAQAQGDSCRTNKSAGQDQQRGADHRASGASKLEQFQVVHRESWPAPFAGRRIAGN